MATGDEHDRVEQLRKDHAALIAQYRDKLTPAQIDVLLGFAARSVNLHEIPASSTLFLEAHQRLSRDRNDPAGWLLFDIAANWATAAADLYKMYQDDE